MFRIQNCLGQPVFDLQSVNALKISKVGRYQSGVMCHRVAGDPQIVVGDQFSLPLKIGFDLAEMFRDGVSHRQRLDGFEKCPVPAEIPGETSGVINPMKNFTQSDVAQIARPWSGLLQSFHNRWSAFEVVRDHVCIQKILHGSKPKDMIPRCAVPESFHNKSGPANFRYEIHDSFELFRAVQTKILKR